ncbi:CshA-type fibril repeat protein [Yoonia maricola]|uniref:CshA-type fibril repeat protein n=1 Tax=Yoonia maricola TaxID=420999 RepID=A0A2M8WLE2_9RHOB|nr:OmpA family protein [Yoonia maricola]PJI91747.1 CshA-type fibril repeat protein [Yoonia maricola]
MRKTTLWAGAGLGQLALGIATISMGVATPQFAQAQAVPGAPTNPAANCTWNWDYWLIEDGYVANQIPTNYNPAKNFLTTGANTPAIFNFATTDLGTNQWYTPSVAGTSVGTLDDGDFPTESTSPEDSERFSGVGYFIGEPGTTKTITFTDTGRNDGHVFAVFNSNNEQIVRFPGRDQGPGSETAPAYYAGPPGGTSTDFEADGGVNVGTAWSITLSFTVPNDGEYYLHYIATDENNLIEFATNNACQLPELTTTQSADISDTINDDGTVDVTYTVTLTNSGELNFDDVDLTALLADAAQLGTNLSDVTVDNASAGIANAGFDGTAANDDLITGTTPLDTGETLTVTYTVQINADAVGALPTSVTSTGTLPNGDTVTDVSDNDTADENEGTDGAEIDATEANGSNTTVVALPTTPTAADDTPAPAAPETDVVVDVLGNDTDLGTDGTGDEVPLDAETVSLVVPAGTDPANVTTVDGDVTQLVVPDEGTWTVNPTTGAITFAPEDGFIGDPTPVDYTVEDDNGNLSNEATVTVTYTDPGPEIELVQTVTGISDTNGDGIFGNAGDTILYEYTAENTGDTGLADLVIDDNGLGDLNPAGVSFDDSGIENITLAPDDGPVVVATAEYIIQDGDTGDLETQPTITSTAVALDDAGDVVVDGGDTVPLFDENDDQLDPVTDDSDTGSEPEIPQGGADGSTAVPTAVDTPSTTDTDGTAGNDADEATVVTLPVIAPEISVETSNGDAPIADGGTDTQPPSVAGVEQTITYTITNDGFETLTLDDPVLEAGSTTNITNGDDGVVFGDLSATSLEPGETATFTVTYTPELDGAYDFDIVVPNNDAQDDEDESDYNIAVAGNSEGAPEIDVTSSVSGAMPDGGEDDVGEPIVGEEQTITYTVTNDGTDTLTLENPTISGETNLDGPVTVVNPDVLVLEPGETTTFTVTFTPLEEGEFGFDIVLPNDDADEAPYDIAVIGSASVFDQEALERVLSEDLQNTTELISRSASDISRRAADRLSGHACGQQISDKLSDHPIRFANDKFFIDEANQRILDEIAHLLNQCVSANFIVAGHTDSDESDAYNLVLSQNRVDAVQDALVARGISADRLQAQGFGESRPIATNATEEGQALNRRVEFILVGGDDVATGTGRCGEDSQTIRTLDGAAGNAGGSLTGRYGSEGYNCVTGAYQTLWADLSVIHTEDASTTGRLSFGGSRDRQANGRLFGQFIEGYVSKTDVVDEDVTGEITGVGVHGGLYGANRSEGGLLLSYYGSAAVGRHFFDVVAGTEVDGHYTYGGVFIGGAVGGERVYETLTLAPRVGVDLAYAVAVGSEISIDDVDLDIDPGRYGRIFVETDLTRSVQNGEVELTPRLFCAISGDEDADCGYGASLSYATLADDAQAVWDVMLGYDRIGDTHTTSLNLAHTTPVFDEWGVSRSSVGANINGSVDAAQTVEFRW